MGVSHLVKRTRLSHDLAHQGKVLQIFNFGIVLVSFQEGPFPKGLFVASGFRILQSLAL